MLVTPLVKPGRHRQSRISHGGQGAGCLSTCCLSHRLRMIHGLSTQADYVSHQEKPLGRIPSVCIHRGPCGA